MKRTLYIIALVLSVVTAIGYTIGKNWEEKSLRQEEKMSAAEQLDMLQTKAKLGDPVAQFQLAEYFELARQDYRNAEKWYRVAATKGQHEGAQYKLGHLYLNGLGVENDLPAAMKWFRLSAQRGDARSYYFLGIAARDGWEGKPDLIEAYKWFLLSDQKHALVKSEDSRFDTKAALKKLDQKMSKFNRTQAQKRADKWRIK